MQCSAVQSSAATSTDSTCTNLATARFIRTYEYVVNHIRKCLPLSTIPFFISDDDDNDDADDDDQVAKLFCWMDAYAPRYVVLHTYS